MEKLEKETLEETLKLMEKVYKLAVKRMIQGVEKHGVELIRKPFEELEEELADAFNYFIMGYIQALKACGGYKDQWDLSKLPDVQSRRIYETKTSKTKKRI